MLLAWISKTNVKNDDIDISLTEKAVLTQMLHFAKISSYWNTYWEVLRTGGGFRTQIEIEDVGGPSPIDVELLNKYKSYETKHLFIFNIETMIRDKELIWYSHMNYLMASRI